MWFLIIRSWHFKAHGPNLASLLLLFIATHTSVIIVYACLGIWSPNPKYYLHLVLCRNSLLTYSKSFMNPFICSVHHGLIYPIRSLLMFTLEPLPYEGAPGFSASMQHLCPSSPPPPPGLQPSASMPAAWTGGQEQLLSPLCYPGASHSVYANWCSQFAEW